MFPPVFQAPGPGGSLDSGPATSPDSDRDTLSVLLYILFLGLLPLIIATLCLVYYTRARGFMKKKRGGDAATSDEEQDGFIRIERRRSSNTKRPPSRLNLAAKDISRPLSVETTVNSLTSSPTHQLLMTHSASVLTASDLEAAVVDGSGRVKVTFHNELYSNFFLLFD